MDNKEEARRIIRFSELGTKMDRSETASTELSAKEQAVDSIPDTENQLQQPEAPPAHPILLNHEIVFLTIVGFTSLILFVVAQFKLSVRNAWILDLTFATIMTLLGIVLSDNLVSQIKSIYADSLNHRINMNHYIKKLKLGNTEDIRVGIFIAIIYGCGLTWLGFQLRRPITDVFFRLLEITAMVLDKIHLTDILESIMHGIGTLMFGRPFSMDYRMLEAALMMPVMGAILISILWGMYRLMARYLSNTAMRNLTLPIRYTGQIILTFHDIFVNIFKIQYFILITWRQFLISCFLGLIKGLITLGRRHYISGIEVDYLLYLKTLFAILGASGYYVCFIRAYS